MQYYSTRHRAPFASLREVIMRSEAPDGGLYLPVKLPNIPQAIFNHIADMPVQAIAYFIGNTLFGGDIPSDSIKRIADDTFNFPLPIKKIDDNVYVLELFHGPSGSINDISSRYMARLFSAIRPNKSKKLNVLVATHGCTGSAMARGLADVRGVNVFILYPRDTSAEIVADLQNSGKNIYPIRVNGSIEECWNLINETLADKKLCEDNLFTCANSINISIVLTKIISYFYAYAKLMKKSVTPDNTVVAVPCKHISDILAGVFAQQMGLPLSKIIATSDSPNEFTKFCDDERLIDLGGLPALNGKVVPCTFDDADIPQIIKDVYNRCGYIMDQRTAGSYFCIKKNLTGDQTGIIFSTVDPAKSHHMLTEILGKDAEHLATGKRYFHKATHKYVIPATYPALKKLLLNIID